MKKINTNELKLKLNQLKLGLILTLCTVSSEVYAIAPIVALFQKGSAALQTIGGSAVIFSLAFLLFKIVLKSEVELWKIATTLGAGTALFGLGAVSQHFLPNNNGVNIQGLLQGL